MESDLLPLLRATQSADQNARLSAELSLRQLQGQEAFPVGLSNIAASNDVDQPLRQSALILLKSYVLNNWSAESENHNPTIPVATPTAKEHVRTTLFPLLRSPSSLILRSAAYVIARVAHADYPEQWPTFMDGVMSMMKEGGVGTTGALTILKEFVDEGLAEDQFFGVAPDLVQTLYGIMSTEHVDNTSKSKAVSIFRSCVDLLEMFKDTHAEPIRVFADRSLPPWLEVFCQAVSLPVADPSNPEEVNESLVELQIEALRTINKLRLIFPSHLSRHLTTTFPSLFTALNALTPIYVATPHPSVSTTAEGESITLDVLATEHLEFLSIALGHRAITASLGSDGIPRIISLLSSFAIAREEEEEAWEDDAEKFVGDMGGDVSARWTVRIACGQLVAELAEKREEEVITALLNEVRAAFSDREWRRQESTLFLLGHVVMAEDGDDQEPERYRGMDQLLQQCLSAEQMLLQGRALILAGEVASLWTPEQGVRLIDKCLEAMQPDKGVILRYSGLKGLQRLCSILDKDAMRSHQTHIIDVVSSFVPSKSSDLLSVVLETLTSAIKVDYKASVSSDKVIPLLFEVAASCPGDPWLTGIVGDAFETMARSAGNYIAVCQRALPPLSQFLNGEEQEGLTSVAVELLNSLTAGGLSPLPEGYIAAVLPGLAKVMSTTDDLEVLQSGQEVLRNLVQKDPAQIQAFNDGQHDGLSIVMVILSRCLSSVFEDSAVVFAGPLIVAVIRKFAHSLRPVLPELLKAVAVRISTASQPNCIQSLIGVYAHLSIQQSTTVVDFLKNITIGENTGLEVVLRAWCENFEVFQRYEQIKLNVVALATVFGLQMQELMDIKVKGDLVITQTNRIMTRSARRNNPETWTSIPVPAKIIKLLLHELVSEKNRTGDDDEEEVVSDDEWDEGDANTMEGGMSLGQLAAFADEEDDEDIAEEDDLLKHVHLKDFTVDFFKSSAANNVSSFNELCEHFLTAREKEMLRQAIA
ncbi:hypothetical protein YB2330_003693 [Saitoella coloradoensis]